MGGRNYGLKCLQCDEQLMASRSDKKIYESIPILSNLWELREKCQTELYFGAS